ncbi:MULTISPECIES: hypothetical protein [unclassified Streptomyces]|uniref:hypothetical protein n=1 Tax=unclassified Streptomyces TaxID=2593676 RepID=UPI0036A18981
MRAPRRPRPVRTALATALCAALSAGAAACGPSSTSGTGTGTGTPGTGPGAASPATAGGPFADLTGDRIVDKAMTATRNARSLTMDISLTTADGPIKAYVSADTGGKCSGTMTVGTAGTVELIKPDATTAYVRFDEAFLREESKGESPEVQAAVLKELKGRWTKTAVSDPDARDMVELCDLKRLLSDFEGGSGAVKGAETTVGGHKALALTEKDGAETYTLHVATEGTPHLLRIAATGGEEPMTVTFSGYGKPVTARVPAAKDVVDPAG